MTEDRAQEHDQKHDHDPEHDQDNPPSREGLTDAQVWEWADDHWQVREIAPNELPNLGGSPDPVDEP